MKACTLCLKTNVNVCQLGNSAAINFIQEIFVNNGFQELNRNNYICILCNYLLNKSYNFIQKTLRAQNALRCVLQEGKKITVATLKQIDRDKLNLDVNLSCQETEINCILYEAFDENVKDNPLENKTDIEDVKPIKTEQTICGSENTTEDHILNYLTYDRRCSEDYVEIPEENLDVKDEKIINELDIKEDVHPYFPEVPLTNSLRKRKKVDYVELSDSKVKSKTKKAKTINYETKDEPDKHRTVTAVKRKRNRTKKTTKRKKKVKEVDTRKYPMKCDHCKYKIQNKMEHFHHYLLYHQDIPYPYAREGKYMCQHCGVVKTTAHVLREHELTHGEKKVSCKLCSKLFHNDTRLKRHLRRHGAVLKLCDYCGKGFVAREDLILHIRTHTGVKPFKCIICGAAFAHRGNVSIHMRSRHQQDAAAAPAAARQEPHAKAKRKGKVPLLSSPVADELSSVKAP